MKEISLTSKKCTPCQGGIPPMTHEVAERFLTEVSGWELREDATRLKRTFKFSNFIEALCLAQHVGELCEKEGHHADITFGWGYCKVEFQTHKINGLHENDFIMAAKVNKLAGRLNMMRNKSRMNLRAVA
jgi:4a-hydroxytetrahydrobiopterin dehydratase